jgi:hypothetical protein
MNDDCDANDLHSVRAGILALMKEKLGPLTNPSFPNQITLNLIRPAMRGGSVRELDTAFDAAVWSLVADGIIVPGTKSTAPAGGIEFTPTHGAFPYFRVTPLGISICTSGSLADPYDRSQYMQSANDSLPAADEVIFTYLSEANKNFLDRSYLSATVMLGVSAEGLMLWLIKRFLEHVSEARRSRYQEAFSQLRFKTNKLFETFLKLLSNHWEEIDDDLRFQAQAYLDQLITIIRVNRDDVAHGRAARVDQQLVYGNLSVYLSLLRVVREVIDALPPIDCELPP